MCWHERWSWLLRISMRLRRILQSRAIGASDSQHHWAMHRRRWHVTVERARVVSRTGVPGFVLAKAWRQLCVATPHLLWWTMSKQRGRAEGRSDTMLSLQGGLVHVMTKAWRRLP